ncbi:MAG TPA: LacI family DNA-binding transcriptional regulator [Hyphomicrobiaceae bacterium]
MTLKQVAEAAGVHFSTASRALNPATRGQVKPQVAERVLQTAQRLGYRANALASSLRTRRSRVIGMVVPDLASLLFPPILEGAEATLLKEGYMTIVANSANDPDRLQRILSGLVERQVDGLILATATLHGAALDDGTVARAPVVLVNRTDESGRAPAVVNDDIRGIGLAVRHVAGLGHRRVAHIAGPRWLSTGVMRLRGFSLAVAELALANPQPPVIEAEAFTREAGRSACLALVAGHPDITAIVAANDLLALGCYDALAERGLACPGDISVTGYNDAPFVDMVSPPLTTVRIDQQQMGVEAARLLLSRINGQETAADVLLRPELVQRRSTAPPRA